MPESDLKSDYLSMLDGVGGKTYRVLVGPGRALVVT